MRKRAKKALALLLALSCSFSTYVSAATIANETVLSEGIKQSFPEEKNTTSSENVMEENALEEDALEENVMGKNVVEEKNEIEKEISAIESEATEENAFYAEKELSGVLVTVQADSGVFPKGATLRVRKLSSAEEQHVDSAVKEKVEAENQELLQSFVLDITVLDRDGAEVQPDTTKGEVRVNFSKLPFLKENTGQQISVFHLDEIGAEVERLKESEIDEEENAVEVKAAHFSLFAITLASTTQHFIKTVALEMGETRFLSDLIGRKKELLPMGAKAESKDPAILSVKRNEEGVFVVEALQEGTTELYVKRINSRTNKFSEESFRITVQKAYTKGRVGKQMEYLLSGTGNAMTLTLRGKGESDFFKVAPWAPYKDKIRKLVIEEGIEKLNIENEAFGNMENLETVSFPSTLKEIPSYAFYRSEKLEDVTIPSSVQKIGWGAFLKEKGNEKKNTITNLSSVFLKNTGNAKHYDTRFSTVQQTAVPEEKSTTKRSVNLQNVHFYTLPEINKCFLELESSGDQYAEYYLYKTENANERITIDHFKESGNKLKTALRLSRVAKTPEWTVPGTSKSFTYCLQDYDSRTTGAFLKGKKYYCSFLVNPKVGTTLSKDAYIFETVIEPTEQDIFPHEDGNFRWRIQRQNNAYTLQLEGSGRMQGLNANGELRLWNKLLYAIGRSADLELRGNITSLDKYALDGLFYIHGDLNLPDSIEEIGDFAFYGISVFGKFSLPSQLKKVGDSSFRYFYCEGDLSLPTGLESIGENAFRDLNSNSSITIPSSVKHIGLGAFYKEEMNSQGKNSIQNYSSVKLSARYANPYFTNFVLDDTGEAPIPSYFGNGGGSSGRGSSSGGGGGSGSGGSGGGSGGTVSVGKPMVLGADRDMPSLVNWQRDAKGWWILNPDGSYPKSQWLWINNRWYYFNQEGYMLIGWLFYNNAWYYFEEGEGSDQGKMCIGWKELHGFWYYFSEEVGAESGKMRTGWQEVKGKWYYLNPKSGAENGKMLFNTKVQGYTLGADGAWQVA